MSHQKYINPLEEITNSLEKGAKLRLADVERWNPPYCGDIGLAIQANGTWTYQNSPIHRLALVKLFSSVLYREKNGRTYLVTPHEKVDVAVVDAAFIAEEMQVQGKGRQQRLIFRTNVDDIVRAGPEHPLRFQVEPNTGAIKPYLLIRHRLEALVTRSVTLEILNLIEDIKDPGVWSEGFFYKIPA